MKQHKFLLAVLMLFSSGMAVAGQGRVTQDQFVIAISTGADAKQVAEMLAQGADAGKPALGGDTPLMCAVIARKAEVVKLLLDKGADANAKDASGLTALMMAARFGNIEATELLLVHGADRSLKNARGMTALDFALRAGIGPDGEVVKLLESTKPVKIDPVVVRQAEFVRAIVGGADANRVAELLAQGADASRPDRYGRLPLHVAIFANKPGVVQLLLDKGADVHAKSYGNTALMVAANSGRTEVIKLLLAKGMDVNEKAAGGFTALDWAVFHNKLEAVSLLLERGASPNVSETPVGMRVYRWGTPEVVRMLVEHGWNVNEIGPQAVTPLMMAAARDDAGMVKLLLEHGADANARSADGWTALMNAAFTGNLSSVELLLRYGANRSINIKNDEYMTALEVARRSGRGQYREVIKLLEAKS